MEHRQTLILMTLCQLQVHVLVLTLIVILCVVILASMIRYRQAMSSYTFPCALLALYTLQLIFFVCVHVAIYNYSCYNKILSYTPVAIMCNIDYTFIQYHVL